MFWNANQGLIKIGTRNRKPGISLILKFSITQKSDSEFNQIKKK